MRAPHACGARACIGRAAASAGRQAESRPNAQPATRAAAGAAAARPCAAVGGRGCPVPDACARGRAVRACCNRPQRERHASELLPAARLERARAEKRGRLHARQSKASGACCELDQKLMLQACMHVRIAASAARGGRDARPHLASALPPCQAKGGKAPLPSARALHFGRLRSRTCAALRIGRVITQHTRASSRSLCSGPTV